MIEDSDTLNRICSSEGLSKYQPSMIAQVIERQFTCDLCTESKSIEAHKCTLNCDHGLCHECLKGWLEAQISEGNFSKEDLKCPFCN